MKASVPLQLFDAHNHIHLYPENWKQHVESFFGRCELSLVNFHIALNGVSPDDWHRIVELLRLYPDVIHPNFGVHPWYSQSSASVSDWLLQLRQLLEEHPNAGVGEIGLDKAPKALEKASFEMQKEVCNQQIALAVEYNRPMNIHCVRAHAELLEMLSRHCKSFHPPGIVLHSFAGSAEMVRRFSSLNCYFSFGGPIAAATSRVIKVLAKVSLDRLLVESDSPDQFPFLENFSKFLSNEFDSKEVYCDEHGGGHTEYTASIERLQRISRELSSETFISQIVDKDQPDRKIKNECSVIPYVIKSIYDHLKSYRQSHNEEFNISLEEFEQVLFNNGRKIYNKKN